MKQPTPFSLKFRRLRLEKNLSQEEMAEKLQISRVSVSNYETGKSTPSFELVSKIVENLELPVNYFNEAAKNSDTEQALKERIERLEKRNSRLENVVDALLEKLNKPVEKTAALGKKLWGNLKNNVAAEQVANSVTPLA